MIEQIKIQNFQSHKDLKIDFIPGINVIKGSSDQGKTAILRAFNWCVNNRPIGMAMNSKWNKKKNKPFINPQSVTVKTHNATIQRMRDGEFNGYKIFDKKGRPVKDGGIDAVGKDLPERITKVFNLSEVNVQKQLDNAFLISESPAEVARFLNKIIRLDLIDKVLGTAENKRISNNKDIARAEIEIKSIEEKIEHLNWTEKAQSILEIYKRRLKKCENNKGLLFELKTLIENYKGQTYILENLSFVDEAEKISVAAQTLDREIDNKVDTANKITTLIESWQENNEIIKTSPDFDRIEKTMEEAEELDSKIDSLFEEKESIIAIIESWQENNEIIKASPNFVFAIVIMDKIENINNKIKNLCNDKQIIENLIYRYQQINDVIIECDKEIKELTKNIPKTCPFCNQKLPENVEMI